MTYPFKKKIWILSNAQTVELHGEEHHVELEAEITVNAKDCSNHQKPGQKNGGKVLGECKREPILLPP